MKTGGFKLAQEMFAVSTPQSHRYCCSRKESLLGLPSPEQEQQVHGHRQRSVLLSAEVAVVIREVGERLLYGAERS